jgi:hypothetical protein
MVLDVSLKAFCVALALSALCVACDDDSVFTDIDLVLPPGDGDAVRDLSRIEIDVHSPSAGACLGLREWALRACGAATCDGAYVPSAAPLASVTLDRQDSGTFGSRDLPVPGDGPWQVVVRGYDTDGEAFLAGCQVTADPGERVRVRMFRPWCDPRACASQFHPACAPTIDCTAMSDASLAESPPCRSPMQGMEVYPWEQDGIDCAPDGGGGLLGNCRPAVVLCQPGYLDPITDGTCPVTDVAETCGGEDLDCDGVRPGACGGCTGTCEECYEATACTPEGTFECVQVDAGTACSTGVCCNGRCIDPETSRDHCGGCGMLCTGDCVGGECDRGTPMCTLDGCNAGRPPTAPRADACASPTLGDCLCGDGPACEGDQICCDGICEASCEPGGDTGPTCTPRKETCGEGDEDCDGVLDDTDFDAVAWCNREGPVANGCTRAGACTCDGERACEAGMTCCLGAGCVNTAADDLHCGECGNPCGGEEVCIDGICRLP